LALTACGALGVVETEQVAPTVVVSEAGIIAEGRLVPAEFTYVSFLTGGTVGEVLVEEGERVAPGQPLIRLAERSGAEAEVAAAELAVLEAEEALEELHEAADLARSLARGEMLAAELALVEAEEALVELDTEDLQEQIDEAWLEVQDAEEELDDAEEEMARVEGLDEDNPEREQAEEDLEAARDRYEEALREHVRLVNRLEQARARVEGAEARLADAERRYEARREGPDPDELALAEARLRRARSQRAAAQERLESAELSAPYRASVVQVNVVAGERVFPDRPVLVLADFSEWYVETTDLTEMEVVEIEAGEAATLVPDALPGLRLRGRVVEIAETYSERTGDVLYEARLLLEGSDPRLRWGMTVEVRFGEG
jgi:multidrug resistance efflux pump